MNSRTRRGRPFTRPSTTVSLSQKLLVSGMPLMWTIFRAGGSGAARSGSGAAIQSSESALRARKRGIMRSPIGSVEIRGGRKGRTAKKSRGGGDGRQAADRISRAGLGGTASGYGQAGERALVHRHAARAPHALEQLHHAALALDAVPLVLDQRARLIERAPLGRQERDQARH